MPARAFADNPAPTSEAGAHTYALIIGSNPGGEGQANLNYAEHDAEHLADVLTQLGHFAPAQTYVLLGPERASILNALDTIGQQLAEHRARAEQAQFVFYYSGHARSNALQLGQQEFPLSDLRQRILALPTTLTLIVLDACQSGAFSTVKGVQPAAAFSYNSVARLRTSGVAVMASSSASELSQESDALRGSYFTHHLIVGLRGAGDRDKDGVVSLAEAYRYAYDRTLSATARTAVGGQHVTLETALTGQGEIPITYPARAGAQLELTSSLEADIVIEQRDSVVAELHKVRGSSMRLALAAGPYTAVLRRNGVLAECSLALIDAKVTPLASEACSLLSDAQARAKGYARLPTLGAANAPQLPQGPRETWSLEINTGFGTVGDDSYTRRLGDFDFHPDGIIASPRYQLAIARQFSSHWSAVVDVRNLDSQSYSRDLLSTDDRTRTEHFRWWTLALGAHLRGHVDAGRFVRFFAQTGLGPGFAFSDLVKDSQTQVGLALAGSAGLFCMFSAFGLTAQATYTYAPLLRNELGDTHDSGGLTVTIGLRLRERM